MKIKEKEIASYNFRKTAFGICYLKFPALYISNRDIGVFKICQQFQIHHLLRLIFNRNSTIIHLQALISGYNFKHLSLLCENSRLFASSWKDRIFEQIISTFCATNKKTVSPFWRIYDINYSVEEHKLRIGKDVTNYKHKIMRQIKGIFSSCVFTVFLCYWTVYSKHCADESSNKKFLIEKKIMKKLSSKDDLHLSGYIGQPADIEVRS